jgi:hypothetical protein
MLTPLRLALRRARVGILVIAATYAVSLGAGTLMVHTGNRFALAARDSIVSRALRLDPTSRAEGRGEHALAATLDFSRNLGLGAVPDTIGGLCLVLPIGLALHRGWVGGVVSVDGKHQSRLLQRRSAVYYLVTILLQLCGYTLAGGAGLHLGWDFFHRRGAQVGPAWFRLPRQALVDAAWIYVLVVPLFALGSWWEFLGPAT